MSDVFATMVVENNNVTSVRNTVGVLVGGSGMFTTGCSVDGELPATHYISSGFVSNDILTSLTEVCYIATLPPLEVLEQLNLKICRGS